MRLSRCMSAASVCIFQGLRPKIKGLLPWQKPLGLGWSERDYWASFLKRYSRTSTCISSSRSILQIMLRALL